MLRLSAIRRFNNVAVWGGGTMGGGIAQVTAAAGIPVTIVEVSDSTCQKSKSVIEKSLARVAKKAEPDADKQAAWVNGIMSKIRFTTSPQEAVAEADLVVEAIVEDMAAKQKLWTSIDAFAPKECVFATNTSSLSVTEQANSTSRPERFGGLHFFSPVPMMKLVEVVKTEKASAETIDNLVAFSKKIGKTPVVCQDTKGFIVNRLLIPYMLEAARLLERGVASHEDIDTAMRLGAGHPMGPFTLFDSVGIDVTKLIGDAWHKEEPSNPMFNPSKVIDEKVAEGKLGRKTGEGFYDYKK